MYTKLSSIYEGKLGVKEIYFSTYIFYLLDFLLLSGVF